MKKIKILIGIISIAFISTGIFHACKKEEILNKKTKKINIDEPLTSYTGKEFNFDYDYKNPYNHIGEKHNELVNELFEKWDSYVAEVEEEGGEWKEDIIVKLFAHAVPRSQELFNMSVEEYGLSESEFVDALINDVSSYSELDYSAKLEKLFQENHPENFLYDFFEEFSTRFSDDADLTFLDPIEIRIIEQKIAHSDIEEDAQNDYLLFCAVYRHSLENLQEWYHNEYKPAVLVGEVTGARVRADAVAAVGGAIAGAKAGVAGGAAGVAIMAGVGAVCYGAIGTAVEVGIWENVDKQIDKGIAKIKSWFN